MTQPRPGRHGAPYVTSCPCGRGDRAEDEGREPAKLTGETSVFPRALLSLVTAAAPGCGPGLHSRQGSGDSCEGHGHLSPLPPPGRRPPPSLRSHCAARRDAAPREQTAPRRFSQCFQGGRSRGRHLPPGWVGEGQERLPWAVTPSLLRERLCPSCPCTSALGRGPSVAWPRAIVHSSPVWPGVATPELGQR